MLVSKFFFACLLAFVAASPAPRMMLHETQVVPREFRTVEAPAAEAMLNLRVALKSTDAAGLEAALMEVSTPDSASYGEHLSKEEVEKYIKPSAQSTKKVNDWLASHGVQAKQISPAGDWLSFSVSVSKASEMFKADFKTFEHVPSGKRSIRTLSYSIPAELKGHLNFVHPMTTFSTPQSGRLVTAPPTAAPAPPDGQDASCSTVTPACLRSLYGIPSTPATSKNNAIFVTGYIDQYANAKDLKKFITSYGSPVSSSNTFKTSFLDGGSNSQSSRSAGVEADLDVQYTVGLANSVPVTFLSVGDNYQDGDLEGFLDTINALLAMSTPPQVVTTSYGDNESNISRDLANQLCTAYAQLGARGTSILFASGDGGVSGSQSGSCTKFVPTFPSGCPFMTSVGSTTGTSPETAADFSSGGFSNYFGAPSYQSAFVSTYLKALGSTNSGKFNTTGRGYPDVSTQGQNFEIVQSGSAQTVDGTSCSSPTFASVIGLLNDKLLAAGKSPLGFLNPFLYSAKGQAALTDITSGSNPGCNTQGFPAKAGWDPVTGLGTPNFAKLQSAVGL